MADGKKKIIVYADWINNFEDLTDEELGKLWRHFFNYVNDLNPVIEDRLIKVAWKPIEATLKRDLQKWETYTEKQKANGKKGGRPKAKQTQITQRLKNKPKKGVSVSVSVSDSVKDSVSNNSKLKFTKHHFKKELLSLGVNKQHLEDWCKVRDKKKAVYSKTSLNSFLKECKKGNIAPAKAVQISAENNWAGFKYEWTQKNKTESNNNTPVFYADKMKQDYGITN